MTTAELCCMVFGHKWWYVGVFTRMCHRCQVVQVTKPEEATFRFLKSGGYIFTPKWRNL